MQQTFFGRARSLAGAVLAGLGIFIFHGTLDRAATEWTHLLSTTPGEALGVLPKVILAAPAFCRPMAPITSGFCRVSFEKYSCHAGRFCSS